MLKKLFILIILCLFSQLATAQNWKPAMATIDSLANLDQIPAATQILLQHEADTATMSLPEQLEWRRFTSHFFVNYTADTPLILWHHNNAVRLSKTQDAIDRNALFDDYLNLAQAYVWNAPTAETVMWFEQTLPELESFFGAKSVEIARFYSTFSLALRGAGDYERCNSYMDQAIEIAIACNDQKGLALYYNNKGLNLYHQGESKTAVLFKEKGIEILESAEKPNFKLLGRNYCMLAEDYVNLHQPEKAIYYLQRANTYYEKVFQPTDGNYYYLWIQYAKSHLQLQNPKEAAVFYQKAHQIDPISPAPYGGLARVALLDQQYLQAHAMIDSALLLFPYTNGMELSGFARAASVPNYLSIKINIYRQQYAESQDLDYLTKASLLAAEIKRISLFNINRYSQDANKKLPYSESVTHNRTSIELEYEQFKRTQNKQHLLRAFDYAEMSKGLLLYQSLKTIKGVSECQISTELNEQEIQIRKDITDLEKQLFEKGENPETKQQLFLQRNAYELVKKNITAQCADYFKNAAIFPENNLENILETLGDSTTLLSYVLTDTAIFTFVVNREQVQLIRTPKDTATAQWVHALVKSMHDLHQGPDYLKNATTFTELSARLYDILVRPVEAHLKSRLIIIPDGVLNILPFEVLLSTPAIKPERFHQHEYWLKKHSISYCYSANLLREMSNPGYEPAPKKMLALAPFYDGSSVFSDSIDQLTRATRYHFNPLPFSGEEVYRVAKIMDGEVRTGAAASAPSLPDQLGDYRILHFATHARSNDQKGEFSYLALRGKTATDNGMLLYVKDIYNLRLRAELVVLSACETGIGELREGEGNISLARAFAYSGAQSIVTTLWSVNDESTKKLMSSFYEFIEKGLPKDQALQQAKLAYLLNNKGSAAHPFFWGGFTVIGER